MRQSLLNWNEIASGMKAVEGEWYLVAFRYIGSNANNDSLLNAKKKDLHVLPIVPTTKMTLDHLKKLSTNFLELLDDKEDFNIIINVGEAPNTKIFRAHSNVLRYRSLYFRDKLANTTTTNNFKTINLKNVTIQQFEIIIK
ncbi:hypothetical protein C2G38_2191864 [Gigaspora rosea]|uniref:BTB domain-containing protein n=1 Tax=Gigaspora rosea TaxID=44941 RepID=A0A397V275_9GLOM|nr:hypothetical protein C2G38_2191864 [Gigaspora rosea]